MCPEYTHTHRRCQNYYTRRWRADAGCKNVLSVVTNFDTETLLAGPQGWLFPGASHITGPLRRIIPKPSQSAVWAVRQSFRAEWQGFLDGGTTFEVSSWRSSCRLKVQWVCWTYRRMLPWISVDWSGPPSRREIWIPHCLLGSQLQVRMCCTFNS